jgi:peptide deformylase
MMTSTKNTITFTKFEFPKDRSELFDFQNNSIDPHELSQKLVAEIYNRNAICLAAPQVGIPYRVFAMKGYPENYVCFNPRVVNESNEYVELEESSLSCPNFIINVKRPKEIRVRFNTPNGDTRTEVFRDLTARTFMHCMDFLEGRKFWRTCSKLKFDMARRKYGYQHLNFK